VENLLDESQPPEVNEGIDNSGELAEEESDIIIEDSGDSNNDSAEYVEA
jgi:hypothetical protein